MAQDLESLRSEVQSLETRVREMTVLMFRLTKRSAVVERALEAHREDNSEEAHEVSQLLSTLEQAWAQLDDPLSLDDMPSEDVLLTDLKSPGFTRNTLGIFRAQRISTVSDLLNFRKRELLRMKDLGAGRLSEIEYVITAHGYLIPWESDELQYTPETPQPVDTRKWLKFRSVWIYDLFRVVFAMPSNHLPLPSGHPLEGVFYRLYGSGWRRINLTRFSYRFKGVLGGDLVSDDSVILKMVRQHARLILKARQERDDYQLPQEFRELLDQAEKFTDGELQELFTRMGIWPEDPR